MKELQEGDRVKVEYTGTIEIIPRGRAWSTIKVDGMDYPYCSAPRLALKRIGAKVKPNQVWQRDSERFYVRHNENNVTIPNYRDPIAILRYGVDLISFATNRRAFHLPPGGGSLEDEGFELILDVEEEEL